MGRIVKSSRTGRHRLSSVLPWRVTRTRIPAYGSPCALIDGGTDILELGMPFSDPVADGPTIQKADERALQLGTRLPTLSLPLSANPEKHQYPHRFPHVLQHGLPPGDRAVLPGSGEAGVDGILIADMPVEESMRSVRCSPLGTGLIRSFLSPRLRPTSGSERLPARASGYLYLVAVLGVTGVRDEVSSGAIELLHRVGGIPIFPLPWVLVYQHPIMRRPVRRGC